MSLARSLVRKIGQFCPVWNLKIRTDFGVSGGIFFQKIGGFFVVKNVLFWPKNVFFFNQKSLSKLTMRALRISPPVNT